MFKFESAVCHSKCQSVVRLSCDARPAPHLIERQLLRFRRSRSPLRDVFAFRVERTAVLRRAVGCNGSIESVQVHELNDPLRTFVLTYARGLVGLRTQWKYLACFPKAVEVIGPRLHHLAARRQMLGMVVRRLHSVAFRVGQLPLNHI